MTNSNSPPGPGRERGLPPGPWYLAIHPLGPQSGERWNEYVAWSGLTHLTEVVTLDSMLCPPVIDDLQAEDWAHNIHADYLISLFHDLDYLLRRVQGAAECSLLAVVREPQLGDTDAEMPGFDFLGYDLIETPGLGISALTNCGGFALAFQPTDLNPVGLLPDYARAQAVRSALRRHYPDEPHADCYVWAIWRRAGGCG